MIETINNVSGRFIGTVYGINAETREVEVYIPKLMSAIPEGRKEMSVPVNMSGKNIPVTYGNNLKYLSTFTVKARDKNSEMPKIGSKVLIWFLDDNLLQGVWEKWNPNGDYEIIEEEKYPLQFYLTVGGRTLPVNLLDNVVIELPEGYTYIVKEDNENKQKVVSLIKDTTLNSRVQLLENMIGHETLTHDFVDENGVNISEIVESSGLCKNIEELQSLVSNLNERLKKIENR